MTIDLAASWPLLWKGEGSARHQVEVLVVGTMVGMSASQFVLSWVVKPWT